jgi:FkbM family methyltransferase
MSFPPEVTTYPTPYGFKFSSCGLDFWQVLATGHYSTELPETLLMLRLLPAIEGFVDVGANIGFYSLLIGAQSAGRVPVISYEPSDENFKTFHHTIQLNGLQDQIKAERKAVGSLAGKADLYLSACGSGGHTLVLSTQAGNPKEREVVSVIPLDQTRTDHHFENKKTLIKIDVEGFEQAVFEGAAAWMASAQPPIFLFEAWPPSKALPGPTLEALMDQLWQCRYVVFAIETLKDNSRLLRKLTKGTIEPALIGNYLALPEWALPVLPELNKPVDIRLFTETRRLEAVNAFLVRSLEALQRHLTATAVGRRGETTR